MKYPLRETDFILINGAIAFGDTLKTMPEATAEDISNIEKFQGVLRLLPEAMLNVDAAYGFNVMNINDIEFKGVNRGWHVGIEPYLDSLITIYSIYTVLPDEDEELEHEKEFYFTFNLTDSIDYDPK